MAAVMKQMVDMFTSAISSILDRLDRLEARYQNMVPEDALIWRRPTSVMSHSGQFTYPKPKAVSFTPANSPKLETFPSEIVEQVDGMLEDMVRQQALNFSMIARFCTMNGYTISSPSVKRYFDRHFSED